MPTTYEPGTFCWADLATNDLAGAKAFYAALLGWRMHDSVMSPTMTYSMAFVGDSDVAAIHNGAQGQHAPGWLVYISVASVDDSTKRAKVLGAEIVRPPHDVADHGRMALLKGPTGPQIALWEAKKHPGAAKMRANGALTWFELSTGDTSEASAFYRGMFGWTAKASPEYTEFQKNEQSIAGMMTLDPAIKAQGKSAGWRVYFQVANVDEKHAQAEKLGAKTLVPPTNIPSSGRFTVLLDPQGATFALYGVQAEG